MSKFNIKGVTLIELMVSVGLGLVLVLSMLAFYSISLQNSATQQSASHDQQQLRKMMNLLETDIENTGGFECAENIFVPKSSNIIRFPTGIISLGDQLERQQIIFLHPIIEEYKHTALGMIDIDTSKSSLNGLINYAPILTISGCSKSDSSPIYIGSTILEVIPVNDIRLNTNQTANDITAFAILSAIQSRRNNSSDITDAVYMPSINDAIIMFLSNNNDNLQQRSTLPFGTNSIEISLGFSPEGNFSYVPNHDMTNLRFGGWITPFTHINNYNLLVDRNTSLTPNPKRLNEILHEQTDSAHSMNTFPLREEAMKQIRAIKFVFTFGAHGDTPERTLTRVIRFKNTHLMKLEK